VLSYKTNNMRRYGL